MINGLTNNYQLVENTIIPLSGTVIDSDGIEHNISVRQLEILQYLINSDHRIVSYQELIDAVWNTAVTDHVLYQQITLIRKILNDPAKKSIIIRNVPRKGYQCLVPANKIENTNNLPLPQKIPPKPPQDKVSTEKNIESEIVIKPIKQKNSARRAFIFICILALAHPLTEATFYKSEPPIHASTPCK